jgi:hypothetical protein
MATAASTEGAEAAAMEGRVAESPGVKEVTRHPLFDEQLPSKPVYRIVITGGPCAGKTTSMARITDFLRSRTLGCHCISLMPHDRRAPD